MLTRDLRRAIARAVATAGFPGNKDPGLRPAGTPGRYAASVALALDPERPTAAARTLARALEQEQWIAAADVTGPGYLTVTVTDEALTAVAAEVIAAGHDCTASDALRGRTVQTDTAQDPLAASTWTHARKALAARLAARLAATAGAIVNQSSDNPSGGHVSLGANTVADPGETRARDDDIAAAVAYAGRDAVTFTLARAIPGKPLRINPEQIARHVLGNPAYAVRYAHARAASGVRWAIASAAVDTIRAEEASEVLVPAGGADTMAVCAIGPARRDIGGYGGSPPREIAALLDALSWLPERTATAARRGRPDEFARYLEDLASVTIDVLSSVSDPGRAGAPGSGRLTLADAARTGLAAGLGLLEVSAPERLLAKTDRNHL